ncbi:hypothetical protein HMPREF9098_1573 [Kingella denitrificans ATCC 33394]|uniref:Uncharacterized protein n=1 Tax=Kingella denitrificans ATCC 33394 TaxID=888741 RepID=F0F0D8_9NEIS|nr:hypothetical protein HMPREF9098_1573 [Kingella denitrificans ATCC 33394]
MADGVVAFKKQPAHYIWEDAGCFSHANIFNSLNIFCYTPQSYFVMIPRNSR